MRLNYLAAQHHRWVCEVGHDNKTPLECLALIASEVGEAVNECRGPIPTPELGEELADIILRTLSLMTLQNVDPEKALLAKINKNRARGTRGRVF